MRLGGGGSAAAQIQSTGAGRFWSLLDGCLAGDGGRSQSPDPKPRPVTGGKNGTDPTMAPTATTAQPANATSLPAAWGLLRLPIESPADPANGQAADPAFNTASQPTPGLCGANETSDPQPAQVGAGTDRKADRLATPAVPPAVPHQTRCETLLTTAVAVGSAADAPGKTNLIAGGNGGPPAAPADTAQPAPAVPFQWDNLLAPDDAAAPAEAATEAAKGNQYPASEVAFKVRLFEAESATASGANAVTIKPAGATFSSQDSRRQANPDSGQGEALDRNPSESPQAVSPGNAGDPSNTHTHLQPPNAAPPLNEPAASGNFSAPDGGPGAESAGNVAAPASAAPEARSAPVPQEASARALLSDLPEPAMQPVSHGVSLRLGDGDSAVDIRLAERAGEVRVTVETPDRGLANSLRSDLPDLVGKLRQNGFDAEAWRPSSGTTADAGRGSSEAPPSQHGWGEARRDARQRQSQQQQQSRNQSRWDGEWNSRIEPAQESHT